MHWIFLGLFLSLVLGIYFKITQVYTKKYFKSFELRYFFIRLILVFIGLYCFISLIYSYNFCKEKSLKKNVIDKILTKQTFGIIVLLTILYAIYLYLYASCIKDAGNYTFVIMNLNILFIFLLGYLFFKEKLTFKTLGVILIFIISGGYLCIKQE